MHALREVYRTIVLKKYGLNFTEKSSISEVLYDKIYSKYKDFIPQKDDVVIDVGAQYGDYALLCAKVYGAKVYTFEPLLSDFIELKKNVALNKASNLIKAYRVALGNKSSIVQFNCSDDMVSVFSGNKKQKVKMMRLDSFKLKPNYLKIDVEGFELEVLKGAIKTLKKHLPKIIIETHTRQLKKDCLALLSSLGYEVLHYGKASSIPNSAMDLVQNIFLEAPNKPQ